MLASIHPLGERGRRQRWGVTVGSYLVASVASAAALGAALGLAGAALGAPGRWAALVFVALAVLGAALDTGVGGLHPPTVHRQVNELWLDRYRGWVYGSGFGAQLGLGVVTIVSTSAVYLALAAALLSGSAIGGLAIGTAFGAVRGALVLAGAGVRGPDQLHRLHLRLQSWSGPAHRLAIGTQASAAAVVGVALIAA
ncbi:MAG: hypothetical protein AB1673_12715 [Actinomycetota bacterium]